MVYFKLGILMLKPIIRMEIFMDDKKIKNLIGTVVERRDELADILGYLRPEELKNGILSIPSALINTRLQTVILSKLFPHITDYNVSFSGGMIFLTVKADAKQLGPVKAFIMLSVDEFIFEPKSHKVSFNYKEDVSSLGNTAQAMMLKALGIGQSGYIQKLLGMSKIDMVTASNNVLYIDLDQCTALSDGFLNKLQLSFQSSNDEILKLRFDVVSQGL